MNSDSPDDRLDIYVPGAWRCLKCAFALQKATIFMQSGTIGSSREDVMNVTGEVCPNDGEPMVRETWHDRADANYKWGVDLMEQIIKIAGASSLPEALDTLRALRAGRPEGTPAATVPLSVPAPPSEPPASVEEFRAELKRWIETIVQDARDVEGPLIATSICLTLITDRYVTALRASGAATDSAAPTRPRALTRPDREIDGALREQREIYEQAPSTDRSEQGRWAYRSYVNASCLADLVRTLRAEVERLEAETLAARDLIRRDAAFQEWAQGYLDAGRWAGHDRSDAIKTELLERDAEIVSLRDALAAARGQRQETQGLNLLLAMAGDWTDPVVVRDAPDRAADVVRQLVAALRAVSGSPSDARAQP